MAMYLEILAKNINMYLELNHKRPAWLAEQSGIKPPHISKILGRSGNPTLDTIVALSDAMEMRPRDLINVYENKDDFEWTMLRSFRRSCQHQLESAEKLYRNSLDLNKRIGPNEDHPKRLLRQVNDLKDKLASYNDRLGALSKKLGYEKYLTNVTSAKELQENTQTIETIKSKAHLILEVQALLTPMDEDKLRSMLKYALTLSPRVSAKADDIG